MSVRNRDYIFKPRRIALIGAEDKLENFGLGVLRNLLGQSFQGVVYIIHPKYEAINPRMAEPWTDSAGCRRTNDGSWFIRAYAIG